MKDNLTANSPTKELAGDEATNDVDRHEVRKTIELKDVHGGVVEPVLAEINYARGSWTWRGPDDDSPQ